MESTLWISESLAGLLPALWLVGGVGLPWALAATPRRDWRCRSMIAALALALGPAWMAAWMLVLGLLGAQLEQPLLKPAWILPGSLLIAVSGAAIAWRKSAGPAPAHEPAAPLALDEKLIVALIAAAICLRWIHAAFWTFTVYDALWVFGYQGRLFFVEGLIPHSLDYYPPFLSLQFAYIQILIGEINDHAARIILPLLHIGSILAAYLLGRRLLNRRVGLFAAALWSLHPHVGQWSIAGDLEIPLAFSFTLAALFFLRAWRAAAHDGAEARNDALLAGMMLGVALFTKPTAGAFFWGVLLLLAAEALRTRLKLARMRPRLQLALWTILASLPLGAPWYLRNLLLGHEAVTFPKAVWLTRALRSGDYLLPLLLLAILTAIAMLCRKRLGRRDAALTLAGVACLLLSAFTASLALSPSRANPPASYVRAEDALLMLAGLALIVIGLRRRWRGPGRLNPGLAVGGGALLLAGPYYLTWFFAYSYHYRLGFAILPLLCLPLAIALCAIFEPARLRAWRSGWRRLYYAALVLLCMPGLLAVATDARRSKLWLLDETLDSDFKKYQVFNPSLMQVVQGLEEYQRESEIDALVAAPGEERLPFFFPRLAIVDQPLTSLAELEELGATHFVYGAKARDAYERAGIAPAATQWIAALGRSDLVGKTRSHYDATFSYELYQLGDLALRRVPPARDSGEPQDVVFGERIRLYDYSIYPPVIYRDTPITFRASWGALQPLSRDYEFVMRLQRIHAEAPAAEWVLLPAPHRQGHYSTTHWERDEFVNDRQSIRLREGASFRRRQDFIFLLGVRDRATGRYLPLEVDGEPAMTFYRLSGFYEAGA